MRGMDSVLEVGYGSSTRFVGLISDFLIRIAIQNITQTTFTKLTTDLYINHADKDETETKDSH